MTTRFQPIFAKPSVCWAKFPSPSPNNTDSQRDCLRSLRAPTLGTPPIFFTCFAALRPRAADIRAFDVSLILYAEHEYNASTFTARVVVSTESDLHSGIVAAIGALKGRLHGGANEKVMDLLLQTGGPANAEKWIRSALARKDKIMGFGHRVYKAGDVRARILKNYARLAAEAAKTTQWEDAADIVEGVLEKEKNLFPNLDWPAGRLYYAMGLEVAALYAIFCRIQGDRLECPHYGAAASEPTHPAAGEIHRGWRARRSPFGGKKLKRNER